MYDNIRLQCMTLGRMPFFMILLTSDLIIVYYC